MQQGVVVVGIRGAILGRAQPDQELGAQSAVRRSVAIEQVEGLFVPADGVVGRQRVAGGVTRASYVFDGFIEFGGPNGGDPVTGELGERRRVVGGGCRPRGLRLCVGGLFDGGQG